MSTRDGGLRTIFKDHLKDIMWVPIETWVISGAGVPDSWYMGKNGTSGWVEYKRHPKRVTPEQSAFLSRVVRLGAALPGAARAFVAVRVTIRGADDLRLYRGADAPALARGGIEAAHPVVECSGGPSRWDWGAVRVALTG